MDSSTVTLRTPRKHPLVEGLSTLMIEKVPSYGNKFLYSLGFLSMISFLVLLVTGVVMVFFGPNWWLTTRTGGYLRSLHLWSTQAFVLFVILHLLIVFFTSGFKKPRRLTWVIGVVMLFVVLAETEFGYILRGDFSSQWRSLQGADFYNGAAIGSWVNPLNYAQVFGIHIAFIPLALLALLGLHYLLVRVLGIAEPYRKDVVAPTVKANHTLLFVRGGVVLVVLLLLAVVLPSPYLSPVTIQTVARQDPGLMAKTLVSEFDGSSDTAGYMDNIDPYGFDTRAVFIDGPYGQLVAAQAGAKDALAAFNALSAEDQTAALKALSDYYGSTSPDPNAVPQGPATDVVTALTGMAAAGLYEPALLSSNLGAKEASTGTYAYRFLADTGALEEQAAQLGITTEQYGMIREETGHAPGAWWLSPIGLLNHTVLANDDNGDRDAAIIFGSLLITMLAFPFIPYVNRLPDVLKVHALVWRKERLAARAATKERTKASV
ncbi:MAG TPA: cytochrome b N-terminal domain-containing protein [Propionibacteriaceae bacterium]|nr:cytochrome b N-terminal domain-containing protein [Propionibacteriaceae bacterium]